MQKATQGCRVSVEARLLLLLIEGMVGSARIATAQSAGTFTQTSNMTTVRSRHSATLLPNGQMLIAGGASIASINSGDDILASC